MVFGIIPERRSASLRNERSAWPESPTCPQEPESSGVEESKVMISQRFRIKMPIIAIVEVNGLYTSLYTAIGDTVRLALWNSCV